jgi:hypothetical protein
LCYVIFPYKRKEKKAAFMVGDKLYVDGVLLKE